MDKVVHFEIPAENVQRAQDFYKNVFDWKINAMPEMKYTILHTVEVDDKFMPKESGAINGGMFTRAEDLKNPIIIMDVKNLDESIEKVKSQGGVIVRERRQVGDMGYVAYFKDTEGNVLGIWETIKK